MEKAASVLSVIVLLVTFDVGGCQAQGNGDYHALIAFKTSSDSSNKLVSWKHKINPCRGRWFGVRCDGNGRVVRIVLENLGLAGSIESLTRLDALRVLSLKGNWLNGTIPQDLSNWRSLKLLFLSHNALSGPLPSSISSLDRLWRLDVSNNKLSGHIPITPNSMPRLLTLRLEKNQFNGSIAQLELPSLQDFNVSGNQLSGNIPVSLSKFSSSAFAGNPALCGTPLASCKSTNISSSAGAQMGSGPVAQSPTIWGSTTRTPSKTKIRSKLSEGDVIAIVLGDVGVLGVIGCMVLSLYCWKKHGRNAPKPAAAAKRFDAQNINIQTTCSSTDHQKGKLVFFEELRQFELDHLLRASAEMLGKGNFGSSYKAVLEDGCVVAVKRLKDTVTGVGRKDFEQQVDLMGKLRYQNVVSLRAYYYARDEKLLVYDYMPNGSLSSLLHGNRGPGRTPLDWTTRMKITLGAARGLAFIHNFCKSAKIGHGNIKSSNVLLDRNGNSCISDFGIAMIVSPSAAASRMAGYRAPEQSATKKISQKADVYSFGVLMLEILTGKAPLQEEGIDLPVWVQSVVREEWTSEVFDIELMRYKNIEDELVGMLQIAMLCVSHFPQQRPKMSHVVKMIEEIRGEQSPTSHSLSESPSVHDRAHSFSDDSGIRSQ